jgi:hypothetical protein
VRIKRNSYYVVAGYPGISGFKDYTRKVESVTTGHKAAHERNLVQREYLATGLGNFELHDGHLPGHRPTVSEVEALRWLDANPFQYISTAEMREGKAVQP